MNTKRDEIIKYIKNRGLASAHEISKAVLIGSPMTHRHLKKLIGEDILLKQGIPPKVYYSIKPPSKNIEVSNIYLKKDTIEIINKEFLLLTPDGIEVPGITGFIQWCNDRNYTIDKKAREYVSSINEYLKFKKNGAIDATIKINNSFESKERFLDYLYYLHPYSIPIFGKTKIAQWLFHAKQTQNTMLMKKVFNLVIPEIQTLIKKINPDAIAFVPPTVPRNIQFMKKLQQSLFVNKPYIIIEKIKMPIMIQQKSLKEIKDRIKNAENTMVVKGTGTKYKKILIIDDFTGSGSTLNILAKKCKEQNLGNKIYGLTITGSMNGFEVIKEV